MGHAYSNPEREDDDYALPDVEVFYAEAGTMVFDDGETNEAGWYWWPCFPGCLPDSDAMGPFKTEDEALKDAQDTN
jgi:hypothetical protein